MRKPKPQQLEVTWDSPEPFSLIVQQSTDGDRIARETQQRVQDVAVSESKQTVIRTRV